MLFSLSLVIAECMCFALGDRWLIAVFFFSQEEDGERVARKKHKEKEGSSEKNRFLSESQESLWKSLD